MPSAITSYGASYFLNTLFGQRDSVPPYYYLALLTQAPGTQTDGSLITEPSIAAGYYRSLLSNDVFTFGGATDGVMTSTAQVLFPIATGDWPTITHYALCDSLVGGQVYLYGNFTVARRIIAGDQAVIGAQALSLSIASLPTSPSSTF